MSTAAWPRPSRRRRIVNRPRQQQPPRSSGTPAFERWLHHGGTIAVGATGIVLGVMKYLMEPDPNSFSIVGHPWQPHVQHLHVLAAPLLVLAIGMMLRQHVLDRIFQATFKRARRTGLIMAAVLLPMIATGYLLQVVNHELTRQALVVVHLCSSGLFLASTIAHVVVARRRARRERAAAVTLMSREASGQGD